MIRALGDRTPVVHPGAWVADDATVLGDVVLEDESSVWYHAVLRADTDRITVGARTNVQDGSVLHADPGFPVSVGCDVSIGHRAVVHGCTVGDGVLVGMGAVLLNGCVIGAGSIVAAGAVVLEGTVVPPGSLVAGVPGKVRRETTEAERAGTVANSAGYVARIAVHRDL